MNSRTRVGVLLFEATKHALFWRLLNQFKEIYQISLNPIYMCVFNRMFAENLVGLGFL